MDAGNDSIRRPVVVGVSPRQPESVLLAAADFAVRLNAELVCAWADAERYRVEDNPDGSAVSLPFDPDLPELGEEEFDPGLAEQIEKTLSALSLRWSVRALAGEPAHALARLAETLDAQLIVVGTRNATLRAEVKEFFAGSIAVHLVHRQHRPVLVVPLAPVMQGGKLPWEHTPNNHPETNGGH